VQFCAATPSIHRVSDVTRILDRVQHGDAKAADELLPLVYEELRRLAAHKMANEAAGQTLQPTALVHEAWLRLGGDDQPAWQNRAHFFAAAAEAMRRILIDRARQKARLRRGGDWQRVDIEHVTVAMDDAHDIVLAIGRAASCSRRLGKGSALLGLVSLDRSGTGRVVHV